MNSSTVFRIDLRIPSFICIQAESRFLSDGNRAEIKAVLAYQIWQHLDTRLRDEVFRCTKVFLPYGGRILYSCGYRNWVLREDSFNSTAFFIFHTQQGHESRIGVIELSDSFFRGKHSFKLIGEENLDKVPEGFLEFVAGVLGKWQRKQETLRRSAEFRRLFRAALSPERARKKRVTGESYREYQEKQETLRQLAKFRRLFRADPP